MTKRMSMNRRYATTRILVIAAAGLLVGLAMTRGAIAQPPPAVPPPPDQGVVDCGQPIYAIDTLICGDPRLREQNERMRGLLESTDLPAERGEAWIESQSDWFRRRAMCAFQADRTACVADAYSERLAVIALLRASRGNDGMLLKCRPVPWKGSVYAGPPDGDIITLRDKLGVIRAVAMPRFQSSWRAFVEIDQGNPKAMVFSSASRTLHCTKPATAK